MLVNELHQGGIRAILAYQPDVFDDMTLPEDIDQQEVVDTIVYKYGDAPLFTPDPAVLKYYIKAWSLHRLPLWERFKAAVEAEYNPIENYDRYETGTDTIEALTSADNATDYQADGKTIRTPDLHTRGNIGVKTSQSMVEEELNLIPLLDVVDYIADDFHSEFCLLVY